MANINLNLLRFNILKFSSSAYHFSHASRLSILIILNLFFYLKLNHYFLFHLKEVDRNDSGVDTESKSREVFLQCAQQFHMFTFCIKDLIMHKNEVERNNLKKRQES